MTMVLWCKRRISLAAILAAGVSALLARQTRADFVFSTVNRPNIDAVWFSNINETDVVPTVTQGTHFYSQPALAQDPDNLQSLAFTNLGGGGANYSVSSFVSTSAPSKSIETVLEFMVNYLPQLPTVTAITVKERNGTAYWFNPASASFAGTLSIIDPTNNAVLISSPIAPSSPLDPTIATWDATAAISLTGQQRTSYLIRYDTTITVQGNPPAGSSSYATIGKDAVYFDFAPAGSTTPPPLPEPASLGLLGLGAMGLLMRKRK